MIQNLRFVNKNKISIKENLFWLRSQSLDLYGWPRSVWVKRWVNHPD